MWFRRTQTQESSDRKMNGWLALSPLVLFLCIYLVSSIVADDFYKVPIAAAFLLASAYAVLITPGSASDKIDLFSEGAGNRNVLLMIWIFVLAGAFAGTAKDMGAIDASVNFALSILPGKFIYAGLFLASCFISMAIGTSVGTIVAMVPMAAGIAAEAGMDVAFVTAIVAGGAFFGDNLSFISDTTIAATRTQGCPMRDKFRVNIGIVAPAAVLVTVIYVIFGLSSGAEVAAGEVNGVKLIPYLLVIGMALVGVNVATVLMLGILANAVIGFACGEFSWVEWLASVGSGKSAVRSSASRR